MQKTFKHTAPSSVSRPNPPDDNFYDSYDYIYFFVYFFAINQLGSVPNTRFEIKINLVLGLE